LCNNGKQIHIEELPAYIPDLNVVDHAWEHAKYGEMANFIPRNLDDLADEGPYPCSANINGPFPSMPGSTYERDVEEFKDQYLGNQSKGQVKEEYPGIPDTVL
jgi:hypothetical protein